MLNAQVNVCAMLLPIWKICFFNSHSPARVRASEVQFKTFKLTFRSLITAIRKVLIFFIIIICICRCDTYNMHTWHGNKTTLLAYSLRTGSSCRSTLFMCWGETTHIQSFFFYIIFFEFLLSFSNTKLMELVTWSG